ncbi:MAG: hypothetical protein ABUL60_14840 [Myxococcales bacterium]
MPKPVELSAPQYQALRARHADLRQARAALEQQISTRGTPRKPYESALVEAEMLELGALIAAEQGGAAYNRSASDLEEIRTYLEGELRIARDVFMQPAPPEPAPLAGPTAKEMAHYATSVTAYRVACAEHSAAVGPAHERLSLAYGAARQAQRLVFEARKASKLYDPSHAVPQDPQTFHPSVPGNVEQIDRDLAQIAAQRVDTAPNGVVSSAELRLAKLRHEREEYEAEKAAQVEADRINALPPRERRLELERLHLAATAAE